MKHLLAGLLCVGLFAGAASAGEKLELQNENDRTSYSVGYQVGGDFKRQGAKAGDVGEKLTNYPLSFFEGLKNSIRNFFRTAVFATPFGQFTDCGRR